MKVNVMSDILKANDLLAKDIKDYLNERGVVSWNIMGSPGSGKTSILERLIPMLPGNIEAAVIEGDLATSNDAERIAKTGAQSTQINTNGAPTFEAIACRGDGVLKTLKGICTLVCKSINVPRGGAASAQPVTAPAEEKAAVAAEPAAAYR